MRLGLLIYGSLDTPSGGFLYDRILVQYLLSDNVQDIVHRNNGHDIVQ